MFKSKPLKGRYVSSDARNYWIHKILSMSARGIMHHLYPRMMAIHDLMAVHELRAVHDLVAARKQGVVCEALVACGTMFLHLGVRRVLTLHSTHDRKRMLDACRQDLLQQSWRLGPPTGRCVLLWIVTRDGNTQRHLQG